ncbi:phage minor capsid protein [Psychrobacillus sp. FSL K6-1267]|uniref:phage minor capsid protein n=1 Tax=Psychrobacillus sp. FSL K6-1267 TaxID=2921543 RepID=UPI0030FC8117
MTIREIPTPNFEDDISRLVQEYEKALRSLEIELNSLFLTDFQRAEIIATQKNIEAIINQLNTGITNWSSTAMTAAVTEGAAATLFSLFLVESMEEARKVVQFSTLNDLLVRAVVADTQTDLLNVSNNVSRKVRNAIQKGTARVMRENVTQGVNGTQTMKYDLLKQWKNDIGEALDTGLIDSAGRVWKPSTYAETVARTKMLSAHIDATTNEALERGAQYGIISTHGAADACRFHEGRIVKLDPNAPGDYPTVDELRTTLQIFHPNCKHVISPIIDLDVLSEVRKKIANQQAELGKRAISVGGRNPQI